MRCGRLGDGVSGRANVISDKEFRDKNKVLMTSNQQPHGKANNVLFSVRQKTMSVFRRSRVFLRLCSLFVDFLALFQSLVCSRHTCLSPGHFAAHTEHGIKTDSTSEKFLVNLFRCDHNAHFPRISKGYRCNMAVSDTIARHSPLSDS